MNNLKNFFKEFFGKSFIRDYRRISDVNPLKTRRFIVRSPEALEKHLVGDYRYFHHHISVNSREEWNSTTSRTMDRFFMDFDVDDQRLKEIKDKLLEIQKKHPYRYLQEEEELKQSYRNLLINECLVEIPINEAKMVAELVYNTFGVYPVMVFSGAKGCHLYIPYNPIELKYPKRVIEEISKDYTKRFNLTTLDPAPSRDATARIARIPYTRHPISGMYAVLFNPWDDYDTIMEKALNPVIEPFNMRNHLTNYDKYLPEVDKQVLKMNGAEQQRRAFKNYQRRLKHQKRRKGVNMGIKGKYGVPDCRELAQDVLGLPEGDYGNYILYKCPFHADKRPSMSVYKERFYCAVSGCVGALNYWNFLKKHFSMTDDEVRDYLRENYPEI